MIDDGREPRTGDSVATGWTVVSGPAGVPDAVPAPHHHRTFHAAHLEVTAPGYRQRRGGASARPVRAKEMPMA
jgi:hypothetical protein